MWVLAEIRFHFSMLPGGEMAAAIATAAAKSMNEVCCPLRAAPPGRRAPFRRGAKAALQQLPAQGLADREVAARPRAARGFFSNGQAEAGEHTRCSILFQFHFYPCYPFNHSPRAWPAPCRHQY
jgi:hypothetical protein